MRPPFALRLLSQCYKSSDPCRLATAIFPLIFPGVSSSTKTLKNRLTIDSTSGPLRIYASITGSVEIPSRLGTYLSLRVPGVSYRSRSRIRFLRHPVFAPHNLQRVPLHLRSSVSPGSSIQSTSQGFLRKPVHGQAEGEAYLPSIRYARSQATSVRGPANKRSKRALAGRRVPLVPRRRLPAVPPHQS